MERQIDVAPPAVPVPAWQQSWLGTTTLESVHELNEQVLMLLRLQCEQGGTSVLIREVRERVLGLDGPALQRAASSGVLLVDAGLADRGLWPDAIIGAVKEECLVDPQPFFTVEGNVALMQAVMTHAWHFARSQPAAARLLLGVSAANLSVIGGCTLSRLTRLASLHSQWLRPRWENRPGIWRDLLGLAGEGASGSVERLRVRGLQLLAADARQG